MLSYSFTHDSPETGKEIRFGTWDSNIEGTVDSWAFKPGDTVSQRKARELPAIKILEPCKHGIQLGGLCCICGKDMTEYARRHAPRFAVDIQTPLVMITPASLMLRVPPSK